MLKGLLEKSLTRAVLKPVFRSLPFMDGVAYSPTFRSEATSFPGLGAESDKLPRLPLNLSVQARLILPQVIFLLKFHAAPFCCSRHTTAYIK